MTTEKKPRPSILTNYTWPGDCPPYPHQKELADSLCRLRRVMRVMIDAPLGVGAVASTLWAADWLMTRKRVRKALILSSLFARDRVWGNSVSEVLPHRGWMPVYGNVDQRIESLTAPVDFFVMNHAGVTMQPLVDTIRRRLDIDLIIVDDAKVVTSLRTQRKKQTECFWSMVRDNQRVWLLNR